MLWPCCNKCVRNKNNMDNMCKSAEKGEEINVCVAKIATNLQRE